MDDRWDTLLAEAEARIASSSARRELTKKVMEDSGYSNMRRSGRNAFSSDEVKAYMTHAFYAGMRYARVNIDNAIRRNDANSTD